MNRYKKSESTKDKPAKERSAFTSARKYLGWLEQFNPIPDNKISGIIPYTLFLTLIALVYIANSYYAEKTVRDIDSTTKELKTLRSEYISDKSELMFNSKQSEVAKVVAPLGIKESTEAPRKIVVAVKAEQKESD
ncbi:MAG TPA: FtsL-like putative cell division protein [Bacteroidia bacterium]|nr:FtsL-like putative cell division protein [Bacteroidia bacterium]